MSNCSNILDNFVNPKADIVEKLNSDICLTESNKGKYRNNLDGFSSEDIESVESIFKTNTLPNVTHSSPNKATSLINTRLVNNSYLWLNEGYVTVPPGVYFNGDFTVSAWIKVIKFGGYQRVFDFGNGPNKENVMMITSTNEGY